MNKIVHTFFLGIACGLLQASEHSRKVTTFIYSHGFTSCKAKAGSYKQSCIIPEGTKLFNYSDAYLSWEQSRGYGIALDFWNSCIGQEDDVNRLAHEVDRHTGPVVLAGESRGASTILNLLGTKKTKSCRIAGAVLDSPFDRVKSVIAHRLQLLGLKKLLKPEVVESTIPYVCWNYNPNGMQPIENVSAIDHEIPMLLICSLEDDIVPYTSSVQLYTKLVEAGHSKAHLLVLAHGKHGWIMQGSEWQRYRQVVHAFYEKYHIEHDIQVDYEMSPSGHDILDDFCRPGIEQLQATDLVNLFTQ